MLEIKFTSRFRKEYKAVKKRPYFDQAIMEAYTYDWTDEEI